MRSERGSAAVAMTGVVTTVAVLSVAVAALGMLYAARAQAANAADAAALAAAVATYPAAATSGPEIAARSAAAANGSAVLACACPTDASLSPRTVQVIAAVRVDVPIFGEVTVSAVSRAEFDPARWLGPSRFFR